MGKRPAFFVLGRRLVRKIVNSPEAAMFSFDYHVIIHPSIVGKLVFRQASTFLCKSFKLFLYTQYFHKEFDYANY